MHRVDAPGHVGNTFSDTAPTTLGAKWHNSVQEELARLVEGSGRALDGANNQQLGVVLATHVDTVAALLALASAPALNNQVFKTLGYWSPGDGGRADYRWNAASTATHDGGSVLKITAVTVGRFELQYSGIISLAAFGVHPSKTGAENLAALHAARDFATVGDTLYLQPRSSHCAISAPFNLNKSLKLESFVIGESGGVSPSYGGVLSGTGFPLITMSEPCEIDGVGLADPLGNAASIGVLINDGAVNGVTRFLIRRCWITAINGTPYTPSYLGSGIKCDFALEGHIDDCVIEGWDYGVWLLNSANGNPITNCKIRGNGDGVFISAAPNYIDNCILTGNVIEGNLRTGVNHQSGQLEVVGCHFEQLGAAQANIKTSSFVTSIGCDYYSPPTIPDIWVTAGSATVDVFGGYLNSGIKHDGTGAATIHGLCNSAGVPVSGTGPISQIYGNVHRSLQGNSGTTYFLSGYAHLATAMAYFNSGGSARIGGATGVSFVDGGLADKASVSELGVASFQQILSYSPTLASGYGSGAGGTVTQLTDKSTGVTLNKVCGQITMVNSALAAATSVSFTLTNSAIAATDLPKVIISSGATANSYSVDVDAVAAGSCRIQLRNTSAGSLSEALVLTLIVHKAVAV